MSSSEVSSGISVRSIITSIIFAIIMVWLSTQVYFTTGAFSFFNPWPYSHTVGAEIVEVVGFLILLHFILQLLGKKLKFTPQEYLVITSALLLSAAPIGPYVAHWTMNVAIGSRKTGIIESVGNLVPSIWTPPKSTVLPYLIGGSVPWNTLLPYLIVWIIGWTLWGYLNLSLSLLMRRFFIEIENLPFPYATPATEFILTFTGQKKLNVSKKWFYIIFILGLISYLPLAIRIWIPYFPVPVMKGSAYMRNWWFINFYDYLKGVAPWAPWAMWPIPEVTALAYLLPLDVLSTISFMHIFSFYILPPIEFSMGIAPPPPPGGFSDWYSAYKFYARKVGIKPQLLFESGGIWAFALFMVIFNWRYFKNLFTYIFKKPPEDESIEPIPYKMQGIFFITVFLLFWALSSAMGVPLILGAILIVFTLFLFIAMFTLRGETGLFTYWFAEPTQILYAAVGGGLGFWSWPASENPAAYSTTYWTVMFHSYNMSTQPGTLTLDSYKIAKNVKIKSKDIFLVQLIFIPLIYIIAFVFTAYSSYSLGIERAFKGRPVVTTWSKSWVMNVLNEPLQKHAYWAGPGDLPIFLSAFIIFPIIMLARMKIPIISYFLNPAGLMIYPGHLAKFFGSALIALIIKYLVLKIGGSRLYEKGIPLVLSFIAGCALSRIIVALIYFSMGLTAPI